MKLIIQITISIYCFGCFCQTKIIPKPYTVVHKSIFSTESLEPLENDFDNDLKKDYINIIENRISDNFIENPKKIIIYLSSQNKSILIDFKMFYGVGFHQPKIKNKTLEFQILQNGTGNYSHTIKLRYNNKYRKIELIGYGLSYKASPVGVYYQKSYNLLTGNYVVTKYSNKATPIINKGYKRTKNKIFVENLTNKIIFELAEIGNEFEK